MKRKLILVLVVSCFFVSLLQGAEKITKTTGVINFSDVPTATSTSVGRYQLLQGTYTRVEQAGARVEIKTVFRIDTETGITEYFWWHKQKDDTVWESWVEIPTYAEMRKNQAEGK